MVSSCMGISACPEGRLDGGGKYLRVPEVSSHKIGTMTQLDSQNFMHN